MTSFCISKGQSQHLQTKQGGVYIDLQGIDSIAAKLKRCEQSKQRENACWSALDSSKAMNNHLRNDVVYLQNKNNAEASKFNRCNVFLDSTRAEYIGLAQDLWHEQEKNKKQKKISIAVIALSFIISFFIK